MPVLKPISGHGSCVPVQRYLEKNGRALARDFFNFSETPDADLMREPESGKPFDWATEMDAFRAECGNDDPWNGKRARTFKHFVLSPSPEDEVSLDELRELAHAWALRFFPEHHIAIIYHDDNENRIPHAHIVVNNTNVVTGRRMHTDNPLDLNRALQEMAAERGLRALSNERPEPSTGFQRLAANKGEPRAKARTLQETYRSRAERRAEAAGGYSWVADIRNRVGIAKGLARNEQEFRSILVMMGVGIEDNPPPARAGKTGSSRSPTRPPAAYRESAWAHPSARPRWRDGSSERGQSTCRTHPRGSSCASPGRQSNSRTSTSWIRSPMR